MLQIARVRPNNKLWGVKVKLHRGNFLSNWKSKTQLFSKSFIFEYSYFSPLFHIFVCVVPAGGVAVVWDQYIASTLDQQDR